MAKKKGTADIGKLTKAGEKRLDKFWDSNPQPKKKLRKKKK